MMLQIRELAIMLGGGVSLGLAVVVLSAPTAAPPNVQVRSDGAVDRAAVERAALEADIRTAERQAYQGQGSSPLTPEQELANRILSSPNATLSDIAMASQILNGQADPGITPGGDNFAAPSRSRTAGALTTPYAGSPSGSSFDDLPAHRSAYVEYGARAASARGRDRAGYSGVSGAVALGAGDDPGNVGAIDRSGRYYAPAGPGAYVSTQDGTLYAPAGPNGVINTRTGAFIPTTP